MIDRRLAGGRWERIHRGVYRVAGGIEGSWRQEVVAACLAAGPPAVASHRTAGRVWALLERAIVEVCVLRGRRLRLPGVVAHEVTSLDAVDVTSIDGIPVTSATRTLIDLAAVLSEDEFEEVLDDGLRRRLTTVARIRWRVEQLGCRRGMLVLRRSLDARDPGAAVPRSVLETRYLRILRRAGLPLPERQYPIRDGGRLIGVVDFAFPSVRLAIEVDGYRWHSGRVRWEKDLARRNALTSLGWRVIHVTAKAMERDPDHVVQTVLTAVRQDPTKLGTIEPRSPLVRRH